MKPSDKLAGTAGLIKIAHDPGDPLITSHCLNSPFCGSGQVVGRSDGTISCDFCGSNYIVRVQPAFPGMPQMPNGPGAPSDVGPDGGLMDPGMIGPDGLPVGGDPMAEDEEGAPPFGDDGDEDEGAPPGAPDDDGEAPPPGDASPKGKGKSDDSKPGGSSGSSGPPKSKKKSSLAVYRGLGGQPLTENQLIRHLAVNLSGHHPAVLAAVRTEAAAMAGSPEAPLLGEKPFIGNHMWNPVNPDAPGRRELRCEHCGADQIVRKTQWPWKGPVQTTRQYRPGPGATWSDVQPPCTADRERGRTARRSAA